MFEEKINIGQDLLNVPMGDMIKDMAFAIAEAQMKLDSNSIEVAEMMGGLNVIKDNDGNVEFEDSRVFFGKEKITLENAITAYNTSEDLAHKGALKSELGNSVSYVNYKELPSNPTTGLTSASEKYLHTTNDNKYFILTEASGGSYVYSTELNTRPTDIQIEKNSGSSISNDTFFYIPQKISMLELGFTPTFYQFVDTIIEVKINIKYTASTSTHKHEYKNDRAVTKNRTGWFFGRKRKRRKAVVSNQVNANFSQKFSYSAEGSSLLRTKLVPIPPPAILEERIQQLMEVAREDQQ